MLSRYLIFCFLFIGAWAAEEDVLEWTDGIFEPELERHENTLVMFYAPWCGHCKHLKPEYAKAAGLLKGNDPPITLAKVDCTEGGKESCAKYSVSGYPTLKIFSGKDLVGDYNGPREADGIAKYMRAQVGPPSKELKGADCMKAFFNNEDVHVIGFFEKDSELSSIYQTLAKKYKEEARFAHTSAKDLLAKEGYNNHVVLYRPKVLANKFESDFLVYEGSDSIGDLTDFITKNLFGLCGLRTRDNAKKLKNPLVVAYYNVDYVKNAKGSNYWRNRVMKVAQNFKDAINFAVSSKDHFQHELNDFGVDFVKGDKPIVLARDEKNRKFVLQDEFSMESFEKFLKAFAAGELEPFLKSEPVPEDNSGPVKVAVAKNFDDLVTNNDKDILVEFYAPWCGHCKKLTPIYDELGEKMANEDVEIVKFDATANDVPSNFEVHGFPTLYWVPKNAKTKPVKYESGRELDQFIKYIAKHATNELKGYDRSGNAKKPVSDEL